MSKAPTGNVVNDFHWIDCCIRAPTGQHVKAWGNAPGHRTEIDEAPTGRNVTAFISHRWGFDHLSTNSWGVAPGFHLSPLWGKNTLFSWFSYTITGERQA